MPSATVLVVDDDEQVRDLLATALLKNRYCVQTARDGRQALKFLKHMLFDVVIVDLAMPVMDGREFAQALDAEEIAVPLLVMSAVDNLPSTAAELGASAFIEKPF